MSNYFNVDFYCNEYFLMSNLLAYSYKFADKNGIYYQSADDSEKKDIDEFLEIARKFPEIKDLINYGVDFDNLSDNESKNKLASNMNERLERFATVKSNEQLIKIGEERVKETFERLKETKFYKSMLKKTVEHKEILKSRFENYTQIAEEILNPIFQMLDEKEIETVVLPPQLFDSPYAIRTQGRKVITLATYPEEFNDNIPNLDVVAMMHEIMHTYIPVDESIKFENPIQEDVYKVINHCLVELSSNGELGMAVSGLDDYFKTPMHRERITNRDTGLILNKEDYIKAGVFFPKEFEFESSTDGFKGEKIVTKKEELSNDKIRAVVYPYFLAFKNKNAENPMQDILSEISRDKKAIIDIYGEEFYNNLENREFLESIINIVEKAESIIDLNNIIARDVFGIELHRDVIQKKFDESILSSSLYELSSETTISDFSKMSQDIRNMEKSSEQTQTKG